MHCPSTQALLRILSPGTYSFPSSFYKELLQEPSLVTLLASVDGLDGHPSPVHGGEQIPNRICPAMEQSRAEGVLAVHWGGKQQQKMEPQWSLFPHH